MKTTIMAGSIRNCRLFWNFAESLAKRQFFLSTTLHQQRYFRSSAVVSSPGVLKDGEDPLTLSNKDWEKRLNSDQYYVCREKGTEIPFSGEYVHTNEKGIYSCACCGAELFSSESKYDSGSGWPSFYEALGGGHKQGSDGNILRCHDNSLGMSRVEVVCTQCDAHLGHVFPDGPKPTGERFCINSASLEFTGGNKDC